MSLNFPHKMLHLSFYLKELHSLSFQAPQINTVCILCQVACHLLHTREEDDGAAEEEGDGGGVVEELPPSSGKVSSAS